MSCLVLCVGSPPESLRRALYSDFRIQSSAGLESALSALGSGNFQIALCCLDSEADALDFIQQAAPLYPGLKHLLLVRDGWGGTIARLGDSFPLLALPAATSPEIIRLNLRQMARDLAHLSHEKDLLQRSVSGSVTALFEVLSIVDPYSASLGQRLRYTTDLFCKSARLEMSWDLETGALLAEVGVLTVPVRVILKHHSGQELSPFEKDMLAHVPERGADLLQQIPSFEHAAQIVRYQGKNFDGSGLPEDSLAGEKLPLGARILKVLSDLFRLKENGLAQEAAVAQMEERRGRYDPAILEIAKNCFEVNLPATIPTSSVPLTIRDLRPGQLLVSNIETDDGVLVIRDGQVISPRLLHKLRNFAFTSGIREPIYVIDLLESRKMTTTFHDLAQSETSFFVKQPQPIKPLRPPLAPPTVPSGF